VQGRHTPRAVLFDLDDTLFDHAQASRAALTRVHGLHEAFARWPFEEFERAHARVLEELHVQVLSGARTVDDAREERFRRLFAESASPATADRVRTTAVTYREAYVASRRPVEGALAVLAALRPRVRIGIVSNNLLEEQQGKIRYCGFESYLDALVVSEAVGTAKPDPAIFAHALDALDCRADEAVMIGDSWTADVEGAQAAGIRAIWFNRARRAAPRSARDVIEIVTLVPVDGVMRAVFEADSPSDLGTDLSCASA